MSRRRNPGRPRPALGIAPSRQPRADHRVLVTDQTKRGRKGALTRDPHPRAVEQTGYHGAYLFGAICHMTGQGVAIASPLVSIERTNLNPNWIAEHARA